jgi:hypothetical protein
MEAAGSRYIDYASRRDMIRLWVIGDVHYGNRDCALKLFKSHLKQIAADPHAYWIGLGDYCDFISPKDRRFDPSTVGEMQIRDIGIMGRKLVDDMACMFMPIADKCVGLGYGNHEFAYMRDNEQQDLHGYLCTSLGVPNLGYSFFANLVLSRVAHRARIGVQTAQQSTPRGDRWAIRLFGHHGKGAAGTVGGKVNSLIRFMECNEADVYLCAHVHEQLPIKRVTLGANAPCTELVDHETIGVITGSYLKSYGQGTHAGYFERSGGRPSYLGAAILEINPSHKTIVGRVEATIKGGSK